MSTPNPQPLRITIIGAGIAGLTCALALRRHNHTVTLLEKSTFHKETGAAMYASPNCSGHLIRLGWDPDSAGAIPVLGYLSILGETGQVASKMGLAEVIQKWNQPWLMVHRVDLQEGLKALCKEEDDGAGKGRKVDLRLGVKISSVDAAKGVVTLDDGTVFESDVIIGADGNNSIARKSVDPSMQLKPWGKSCYRFLMNKEMLMRDEEVKGTVEDDGYFLDVLANDRKFVAYPCRNNREINVAAFLPDEEMVGRGDDWEQEGNKAKMMKGFESFSPAIKKLLSYADEDLKVWQLVDMDQLKHWNKDRVALIGDAAHPFLPFLGQGAAQAVEDAICIATLLQPGTSPSDIPDLMKLYDEIRRERVDYLQAWTRKNGQDEDKERPPPEELFCMLDYSHKHDEWMNTQERLEGWRRGRGENRVVDH